MLCALSLSFLMLGQIRSLKKRCLQQIFVTVLSMTYKIMSWRTLNWPKCLSSSCWITWLSMSLMDARHSSAGVDHRPVNWPIRRVLALYGILLESSHTIDLYCASEIVTSNQREWNGLCDGLPNVIHPIIFTLLSLSCFWYPRMAAPWREGSWHHSTTHLRYPPYENT